MGISFYRKKEQPVPPLGSSLTQQTTAIREELGDNLPPRLRKQLRAFERDCAKRNAQRACGSGANGNTSLHSTVSSTAFAAIGQRQIYPPVSKRPPAPSTPIGLRSPLTHMPTWLPKEYQA